MTAPPLEQPPEACAIDPATDHPSGADVRLKLSCLEPFHRTVIMTDVAGFSTRDNRTQLLIRAQIYRMLEQAFIESGTDWNTWIHEDRGDGVLIIVPPDVSKARLLGPFPVNLAALLREHAEREEKTAFGLRMVIHAGDIVQDDHGHSGPAINLAARLLDASVLRTVLSGTSEPLVLATSDTIYENIVRQGYDIIDPNSYQHTKVTVKGTRASLWIHVPTTYPPLRGIPRLFLNRKNLAACLLTIIIVALSLITPFNSPTDRPLSENISPVRHIDSSLSHSVPEIDSMGTTRSRPPDASDIT